MAEPVAVLDVLSHVATIAVSVPAAYAVINAIDANRLIAKARRPENKPDRALLVQEIRAKQLMASLQKPWALLLLCVGIGLQIVVGGARLLDTISHSSA